MSFSRSSGVLLHPTSFPSRFGVGDLGRAAYQFIDFLRESGQQLWQILPLGPTGHGNSPYMCYGAMAGNPLLISPDILLEQGLLTPEDLENLPEFPPHWVDYDRAASVKDVLLHRAAARFQSSATHDQAQEFNVFCASSAFWLNDYALFMALKEAHGGKPWHEWDEAIARRDPETLEHWRVKLSDEVFRHKFLQFEFFRQWSNLKTYANESGIEILGDIPIYVAHDSVDVWAFPQWFHLDPETLEPALMAGVPPDYFSETGQLWGNPIYHWEEMQKTGFEWWMERFRAAFQCVDLVRIDHFRGFAAYWAVNQGETTAIKGDWLDGPGHAFFETLHHKLGNLPIIAEDLGVITPDVVALREAFGFPGMKVLHFAFGSDADNPFLPFNYDRNYTVYTGTHDNNTTVGWFDQLSQYERDRLLSYLGCVSPEGIHWSLIRLAMSTVANQAVFPLQDILGLGNEARMNFPGKPEGNWAWRYEPWMLTQELQERLLFLTHLYGRAPKPHLKKPPSH